MSRDGRKNEIISALKDYMCEDRDYRTTELVKYLNETLQKSVTANHLQIILRRSIDKEQDFVRTGRGLYQNRDLISQTDENEIRKNDTDLARKLITNMVSDMEQCERLLSGKYTMIDVWNASKKDLETVQLVRSSVLSVKSDLSALLRVLESI